MKFLIFLSFFLPSLAHAWSDWTQEQKNWFVAANVAIVADWSTTRNMTRRYDEGYYERNPLLGRQPSTDRLDLHFITWLASNYFIADYLSNKNRTVYLKIVTGVHSAAALNNLSIGLKLEF